MKSKLVAVVLFALMAAACGQSDDGSSQTTAAESSTTSTTTTTAVETTTTATPNTTQAAPEPSQSAADARRDGVVAALAALPVSVRVVPEVTVPTDEGLWVLSRPGSEAMNEAVKQTQGCGIGDPAGLYGRDLICVGEYGEVLLMDAAGEQILRAYPLPALPPNSLVVTDDAVYCGRYGDGALPDSMICRIDRTTLDWIVRVFPWETDSALNGELFVPDNWTIDGPIDESYVETMTITKDGLVVGGWGGEKLVDPLTLQLGDTP